MLFFVIACRNGKINHQQNRENQRLNHPTSSSKKRKGIGMIYATKAAIDAKSTSPANTLPKRRNESEATFANSPTISIKPTKNVMGATITIVGSLRIFCKNSSQHFQINIFVKSFPEADGKYAEKIGADHRHYCERQSGIDVRCCATQKWNKN